MKKGKSLKGGELQPLGRSRLKKKTRLNVGKKGEPVNITIQGIRLRKNLGSTREKCGRRGEGKGVSKDVDRGVKN